VPRIKDCTLIPPVEAFRARRYVIIKVMRHLSAIAPLLAFPLLAASSAPTKTADTKPPKHACVGSLMLATFKLSVLSAKGSAALSLSEVNTLSKGEKLYYEPVHIPPGEKNKAEISILLAPAANSQAALEALKPELASKPTVWNLPADTAVVALVYGPQGLSMRKVKSLMQQNDQVLSELADYADETEQVSALIQQLQTSEDSGTTVSAALAGFSAQSGVSVPAPAAGTTTNQQAATLLHALSPSMSSMDPLTGTNTAVVQQSTGLATAVASLFFGNPVGLVAGGASLFENMHAMLFPETEFQSILAQTAPANGICLCAKPQNKARTRVAYLWAHRLPDLKEPKLSLAATVHIPMGAKSGVAVHADTGEKAIARLREWRLTPAKGGAAITVPSSVEKNGEVQLDLSKAKTAPGEYHLAAYWDWDELHVSGDVYLHPYGDLKLAKLSADSRDKLVEGSGPVKLKLSGTDFEFVDKAELESAAPHAGTPVKVAFTLPHGERGGDQQSAEAEVDTTALKPGQYKLLLAQSGGASQPVPVTVLPPNPKLEDLPLRPNLDEPSQKLMLHGSGLDRIEKLSSAAGVIELAPARHATETREATIKLGKDVHEGQEFDLKMTVQGIDDPITMADAVRVRGARPHITAVRNSFPQSFGLTLNAGEIPSSVTASFALEVAHAGDAPLVNVTCADAGSRRQPLELAAGDRKDGASLDMAGEGELFLSFQPGTVGRSGCMLQARVTSAEGVSDPYRLGRILRVPRIEQFVMSDQKLSDGSYQGTLTGEDLDLIQQTGWDAQHGLPVQSIPDAVAGDARKQVLKIEMPWPAPAPHAPVFVWLRGEQTGRATGVQY